MTMCDVEVDVSSLVVVVVVGVVVDVVFLQNNLDNRFPEVDVAALVAVAFGDVGRGGCAEDAWFGDCAWASGSYCIEYLIVHIVQLPLVSMAVITVPVASMDTDTIGEFFSGLVVTYHPMSLPRLASSSTDALVELDVGVLKVVSFVVDAVVLLSTIIALVVASLTRTFPSEYPQTTMYIV